MPLKERRPSLLKLGPPQTERQLRACLGMVDFADFGSPLLGSYLRLYKSLRTERQGIALEVLTQMLGDIPQPLAYLSKQFYSVSCEWHGCLQAVATIAPVRQGHKLLFRIILEIETYPRLQRILKIKGHQWLTGRWLSNIKPTC